MARKPVPIRLDTKVIADLDDLAKHFALPRTWLIETGVIEYVAKMRKLQAMDLGPPKKPAFTTKQHKAMAKAAIETIVARTVAVRGKPIAATDPAKRVIGWDMAGEPIYAGGGK